MRYILNTAILFFCLPSFITAQSAASKFAPVLKKAKATHSSALVIIDDSKKVIKYYRNGEKKKIESMSVTKSVVALAVAKLLSDGKIDSLNTPVANYYPEWKQGEKKNITIKHLMNHTSGLQNVKSTRVEIQPSPDFIQLGLCASVVNEPGTKFSYNNKAVNILSGIVRRASGQKLDEYLESTLFKEMDITDFKWRTDDAGHPRSMAGFIVYPEDLAKLGQLVLQKGMWNNKELINEKWIDKVLAQSQPYTVKAGLLWWRIPAESKVVIDKNKLDALKKAGLDEKLLAKLSSMKGTYQSQGEVVQELMKHFSRAEIQQLKKQTSEINIRPWKQSVSEEIIGYKAEGWLGQYILIFPLQDLVAVRMIENSESYNRKTDGFNNFPQMVYEAATASN